MTAYVALLRGIAPMNPLMKNAALVAVFESIGLEQVRAVISSGNLLFESPGRGVAALEARIEAALHEHLGAPCTTFVRSRSQIAELAALDVFDAFDDGPTDRCNVTFLKRRAQMAVPQPPDGPNWQIVAVRDLAVFTVADSTSTKGPNVMVGLERAYGKDNTTRTWRTVHRIDKALTSAG